MLTFLSGGAGAASATPDPAGPVAGRRRTSSLGSVAEEGPGADGAAEAGDLDPVALHRELAVRVRPYLQDNAATSSRLYSPSRTTRDAEVCPHPPWCFGPLPPPIAGPVAPPSLVPLQLAGITPLPHATLSVRARSS
jgi:hypothetical protein